MARDGQHRLVYERMDKAVEMAQIQLLEAKKLAKGMCDESDPSYGLVVATLTAALATNFATYQNRAK